MNELCPGTQPFISIIEIFLLYTFTLNINAIFPLFSGLNEDLVTLLMERDDLHMEQDSMLVDIEDLTKHMWVSALWGKIFFYVVDYLTLLN